MLLKSLFKSIIVLLILSLLLLGCARFNNPQHPEALSSQIKIPDDTTFVIDRYDFSEDQQIMAQWSPSEWAFFFEHFVFSIEELEQEIGIKLPE